MLPIEAWETFIFTSFVGIHILSKIPYWLGYMNLNISHNNDRQHFKKSFCSHEEKNDLLQKG